MSVIIRKLKNVFKEDSEKDIKEMGQSSASLKIYTSASLERRKEECRKIYDLVSEEIDETDPIKKLDALTKRVIKIEQKIGLECAPYLRAAEYPQHAQILSYWRKAYSLSWIMLQVTKADIQSMTDKKGIPLIDVNHQAERMHRFIVSELFSRAFFISKISYFGKDVAPEFIFSTLDVSQPRTIIQRGPPTNFTSQREG